MGWGRIAGLSLLMLGLAAASVAAEKPTLADAAEHGNRALIRTLLDRGADVPIPLRLVRDAVDEANDVAPGNLCNNLLHKHFLRVGLGEGPHILEVARRESLHFWEGAAEITR